MRPVLTREPCCHGRSRNRYPHTAVHARHFRQSLFATFYEGVGQVCEEHSLSLLTVSPMGGSLYKAVANAPVDGFIVVGLNETHEDIEVLNKRNIPFVIVDGDSIRGPSVQYR